MPTHDDVSRPAATAVTMPRSEVRTMRSRHGRDYRLFLAWPSEAAPPSGFPVIYLLDAQVAFGTMVEAIRMRSRRTDATNVLPAIVAGIGYPADGTERVRRTYDYTPPAADGAGSSDDALAAGSETGGAAAFLDFLDREIKPAVAGEFTIDRSRQSLFGHSLGGRFVLHALLTSPASFQSYVAVSPSVWWDRGRLFESVAAIERDPGAPLRGCRVMMTVGEYEQRLAPWQRGTPQAEAIATRRRDRRMVDDGRELAARLEAVAKCVQFEEFAGEDHASVVPRSVSSCLRFCLGADGST